jgi:hypothetical protein
MSEPGLEEIGLMHPMDMRHSLFPFGFSSLSTTLSRNRRQGSTADATETRQQLLLILMRQSLAERPSAATAVNRTGLSKIQGC